MRSGYSTTIPRKKNITLSSINRCHRPQHQYHGRTFMVRRSCSVSGETKRVLFTELLKPGDSITGDRYRLQLIRLSRALQGKRPEYEQKHDKVILLHDNARPHVAKVIKKYLETLKWNVLPHPPYSGHCSFWLLVPKDAVWFSKSPVHFFRRNQKLAPKLDRFQDESFFEVEFENYLRDGKK